MCLSGNRPAPIHYYRLNGVCGKELTGVARLYREAFGVTEGSEIDHHVRPVN
jgi:hypothetical protein